MINILFEAEASLSYGLALSGLEITTASCKTPQSNAKETERLSMGTHVFDNDWLVPLPSCSKELEVGCLRTVNDYAGLVGCRARTGCYLKQDGRQCHSFR